MLAAGAFSLESDRDDRWQETQEREQASTVAAWPGRVSAPMVTDSPIAAKLQRFVEYDGVYIRNASQVPVTNVRAVALDQRGTVLGYVHKQVVPPNAEATFYRWDEGTSARVTGLRKMRDNPDDGWLPEVDLYFTDAAGKFWHRASLGILHRRRLGDPLPEPRRS